jgi:hypothetical protein
MRKVLAGILFGLSVTAANFILNKNKNYSEYISKNNIEKQQKWIHIE